MRGLVAHALIGLGVTAFAVGLAPVANASAATSRPDAVTTPYTGSG